MIPEEIRSERNRLEGQIQAYRELLEELQERCLHPNAVTIPYEIDGYALNVPNVLTAGILTTFDSTVR